jgi:hypothetical protein
VFDILEAAELALFLIGIFLEANITTIVSNVGSVALQNTQSIRMDFGLWDL